MNGEYPANGPWQFTIHRIVSGKITRLIEYWPEPYAAPANRAHLVERID